MKPVKIYTVISGNGGSAKSTTAANAAYWISRNWKLAEDEKILLASLDEQDDSTYMLNAPSSSAATRFLTEPMADVRALAKPSSLPYIDVLASNRTIGSAETMMAQVITNAEDPEKARAAYAGLLRSAGDQYRAVIYDSANSGYLRDAAIRAAERLFVTTRTGNHNLKNTLALIKMADKLLEPGVGISILPVMINASQRKADDAALFQLWEKLMEQISHDRVLTIDQGIPYSVHVDDAVESGLPLLAYAPHNATTVRGMRKAAASKAYNEFFFQTIGV